MSSQIMPGELSPSRRRLTSRVRALTRSMPSLRTDIHCDGGADGLATAGASLSAEDAWPLVIWAH